MIYETPFVAIRGVFIMSENSNLNAAKKAKNDEFYTQYMDIEKELYYYKEHLNNKIIYCNCDNPSWSNFYRYFRVNFFRLGLKKLVSSYYNSVSKSFYSVYDGKEEIIYKLKGNGDFRSNECKELLKEADIVVSNPPFSLFREYVAQLIEYEKKFLIIGAKGALVYKEIFPLMKETKIWLGVNKNKGTMSFFINNKRTEKKEVPSYWYTNLEHYQLHNNLNIYNNFYDKSKYPKYVNFDAIEVSKLDSIPCDYDGLMGVPITIFQYYNPKQFEIIGISDTLANPIKDYAIEGTYVKGGKKFYLNNNDGTFKRMYSRVVIKRNN